jgi:hypothetical protein
MICCKKDLVITALLMLSHAGDFTQVRHNHATIISRAFWPCRVKVKCLTEPEAESALDKSPVSNCNSVPVMLTRFNERK